MLNISAGWTDYEPVLGWGAGKPGTYHATSVDPKTGATIYSVDYTFDANLTAPDAFGRSGTADRLFRRFLYFRLWPQRRRYIAAGLRRCAFSANSAFSISPTADTARSNSCARSRPDFATASSARIPSSSFSLTLPPGMRSERPASRPGRSTRRATRWRTARSSSRAAATKAGVCGRSAFCWTRPPIAISSQPYLRRITRDDIEFYIRELDAAALSRKEKYHVDTLVPYVRVARRARQRRLHGRRRSCSVCATPARS